VRKLHMLALATSCVFVVTGCSEKIDARQLQLNNGLNYRVGENDPFSGTVTNIPVSEFARVSTDGSCVAEMKSGVVDGKVTCVTPDSKQLYEGTWRQGKRDGTEKVWFPTGQLVSVGEWKGGRKDGVHQRFNPMASKLISETHWLNGNKAGQERHWDVSGNVLLVDLQWNDGKKTGFSKAGTTEEHFVDGKLDGVVKNYALPTDSDKAMADATNAALAADRAVEQLGGGVSSYSLVPGAYVSREEHWSAGTRLSVTDLKLAAANSEACVDKWIASFRKSNGADAVVSNDQATEWKSWCAAGKLPTE
jgi:antitoxin component YwqK of YwqJK toxin-antitoxin module